MTRYYYILARKYNAVKWEYIFIIVLTNDSCNGNNIFCRRAVTAFLGESPRSGDDMENGIW